MKVCASCHQNSPTRRNFDLEVSWHQASVGVGAVPRQVVVDSPSQTLFGVNRCGVFEARIKSTFPWRDVPPPPPVASEKAL